ncbi:Na+/H+ antiporter subunit D [Actinomyces minihominis]|uniref:Na+/H+ antiporter subunit D n=1 Tax=Actinomyces minihominis TaxID=2002838 RepID=UPI000C0817DE|nr:Na+/H+ antiporter subunit D [Actinomyces minihominis]
MTAASLSWLVPLPVLIPLVSAGLALILGRRPRLQQLVALIAMLVSTVIGFVLVFGANSDPIVLDVGSWAAPIGITLVADRLSTLMLVVSQVVALAVLIYSIGENVSDPVPTSPVAVFYPTFLILSAGVSNSFLTGDLFNLYVGFEILLAASFVLITLGGTRGRVRSGTVYVIVSLFSSVLFLIGIAWIYGATGTMNMAQLSVRLAELPAETTMILQAMLLVAFGVKAAIFPLASWLPDSYPTAPAPVTAVFAGLLTKVGVYAIIRLQFVLFPGDRFSTLLAIIGILSMIIGILGAVAQDDAKRLLSFTLISHIGFMMWGISLDTVDGLGAAIYYAAHHIVVQTALFLIVGLIERYRGTTSLTRLSDLAREKRWLSILFMITALNLVGMPPLTGFIGKLGLAEASVLVNTPMSYALLASGILTSFLTLYVAVKFWNKAFWQPKRVIHDDFVMPAEGERLSGRQERIMRRLEEVQREGRADEKAQQAAKTEMEKGGGSSNIIMYSVATTLVAVQIGMAIFSGPIYGYAHGSASNMMDNDSYVRAVLGEDGRGQGVSKLPPFRPPWIDPNPLPPLLPAQPELPEIGGNDAN